MRAMRPKIEATLAVAFVLAGVALLALPTDWIERSANADPGDGGLFELLIGVVPLALGLLVGARLLWHRSGGRGRHVTIPIHTDRRDRR